MVLPCASQGYFKASLQARPGVSPTAEKAEMLTSEGLLKARAC